MSQDQSRSPVTQAGPAMVRVGEQPRPRVLVIGFGDEPSVPERLCRLAPTVQAESHLGEVDQGEWDMVVTDRFATPWPVLKEPEAQLEAMLLYGWSSSVRVEAHLSVVYRSDGSRPHASFDGVEESTGAIGDELSYPADLSPAVRRLVTEVLLPAVRPAVGRCTFRAQRSDVDRNPAVIQGGRSAGPTLHPFLSNRRRQILAGRYDRSGRSEGWVLPPEAGDVVLWVAAALAHLHRRDPDRYPAPPDWTQRREWQTPAEVGLIDDIAAVERERTEVLQRLDVRERSLRVALGDARATVDGYERGLLTAQGNELVALVIRALRELGFEVVDSDAALEEGQPRRQDLEVTDPGAPGWTALAEVKGYATSGGKSNDLLQIANHAELYLRNHPGLVLSARWYLVNHMAGSDPAQRRKVLAGDDENVATFADRGGSVWGTVDLFAVLMGVRSGRVDAADARTFLREARGRLALPPSWAPVLQPGDSG